MFALSALMLCSNGYAGQHTDLHAGAHLGVTAGGGVMPGAALTGSSDTLHLAGEVGYSTLPFLVEAAHARLGASIVVSEGERSTWRLQPMVGIRRVRPLGGTELVLMFASAVAGEPLPSLEPVYLGTVTAAAEGTWWASEDVGLVGRATLGFGTDLKGTSAPELGLSAGISF